MNFSMTQQHEPPPWIDTHVHLDAPEYDADRLEVIQRAFDHGVRQLVIPAIAASNWQAVIDLAHGLPGSVYVLGIHPLCVSQSKPQHLEELETMVQTALHDPQFAGIGEIGLDGFVPDQNLAQQEWFFQKQLQLAQKYRLPVVMHVRKAQDRVLKYLRQHPPVSGIAHAFNGSQQQAMAFLQLGLKLGFGGACTFTRALNLRRLAAQLPLNAIVLETDGPDIPPSWLGTEAYPSKRNEPMHVPGIAAVVAQLRGTHLQELAGAVYANACAALPALTNPASA